jgi:hypothetical protein
MIEELAKLLILLFLLLEPGEQLIEIGRAHV